MMSGLPGSGKDAWLAAHHPDLPVVSLDDVAHAMKLVAERAHIIAEGAAGCAIAAALSGRAGAGKVVAVVSGGNIDLSRFAALVGACPS